MLRRFTTFLIVAILLLAGAGVLWSAATALPSEVSAMESGASAGEESDIESDYVMKGDLFSTLKNGFRKTLLDVDIRKTFVSGFFTTIMLTVLSVAGGILLGTLLFLWGYSGSKASALVLGPLSRFLEYLPTTTLLIVIFYIFMHHGGTNSRIAALTGLTISFAFNFLGALEDASGEISRGEYEAAITMGYDRYAALFKVFFPGMLPSTLESARSALPNHVENTSIVELIAVVDIQAAADMAASGTGEAFFPLFVVTVVYLLIGIGIAKLIELIAVKVNMQKTKEQIMAGIRKGKF